MLATTETVGTLFCKISGMIEHEACVADLFEGAFFKYRDTYFLVTSIPTMLVIDKSGFVSFNTDVFDKSGRLLARDRRMNHMPPETPIKVLKLMEKNAPDFGATRQALRDLTDAVNTLEIVLKARANGETEIDSTIGKLSTEALYEAVQTNLTRQKLRVVNCVVNLQQNK